MREKIYHWVLDHVADAIIKFLAHGGFTIINRNDAALLFREGADRSDFIFPWHLYPNPEYLKEHPDAEMPPHLAAASVFGFMLRKKWLMRFISFYSANEKGVDANLGHLQEVMDGLQQQTSAKPTAPVAYEKKYPTRNGDIVH